MNRKTRRALRRVETSRFSGRCRDVSDRTLRLAEAIAICDDIQDALEPDDTTDDGEFDSTEVVA